MEKAGKCVHADGNCNDFGRVCHSISGFEHALCKRHRVCCTVSKEKKGDSIGAGCEKRRFANKVVKLVDISRRSIGQCRLTCVVQFSTAAGSRDHSIADEVLRNSQSKLDVYIYARKSHNSAINPEQNRASHRLCVCKNNGRRVEYSGS